MIEAILTILIAISIIAGIWACFFDNGPDWRYPR